MFFFHLHTTISRVVEIVKYFFKIRVRLPCDKCIDIIEGQIQTDTIREDKLEP
jgi:hypothetical protein